MIYFWFTILSRFIEYNIKKLQWLLRTNNNPPRATKRYLADWIFPNLTIDTFDTRKRNKVHFLDVEEGIVCFRELSRISHIFGLARHWRIAVAEPVFPGHGSVGSQVKLFPSLNWRPGAPEMRAQRLPVLWALAFYWFNLCALSSRRYFPHRPIPIPTTYFQHPLIPRICIHFLKSSSLIDVPFLSRLYVFFSI